jgi:hypothetical protein
MAIKGGISTSVHSKKVILSRKKLGKDNVLGKQSLAVAVNTEENNQTTATMIE